MGNVDVQGGIVRFTDSNTSPIQLAPDTTLQVTSTSMGSSEITVNGATIDTVGSPLTLFNPITLGGNLNILGDLTINNAVEIESESPIDIDSTGDLTFNSTVNGYGFNIVAAGAVEFGVNVGSLQILNEANITAAALTIAEEFNVESNGLVADITDTITIGGDLSAIEGARISLTAGKSVILNSGSSITSEADGEITLIGNDSGTATGDFSGVLVRGQITTADGNVLLEGKGGSNSLENHGVKIWNGTIQSTGVGEITIDGRGSAANGSGVRFEGSATVTSASGAILVTAFSELDHGISFFGGTIESTATAPITIVAETIGAVPKVALYMDPGYIRSVRGHINVNLVSNGLAGLLMNSNSEFRSTGTNGAAEIQITANNSNRMGIALQENSLITSAYGDITLNGTGGPSGPGFTMNDNSLVSTTGVSNPDLELDAPALTIIGNGPGSGMALYGTGTRISSADGAIALSSDSSVSIGGEIVGLEDATLLIAAQDLTVTADVTIADAIDFSTVNSVLVTNAATVTADSNTDGSVR